MWLLAIMDVRTPSRIDVANTAVVLAALRRATSTIPIVFAVVSDPLGQGFISSLFRPGGNITGFTFLEVEILGKWINLLNEVKPDLTRVALMFNPDTAPFYDRYIWINSEPCIGDAPSRFSSACPECR